MTSMRQFSLLLAVLCLAHPASAATPASMLENFSFKASSLTQWKLPNKLREISGLVFHQGRLFAHNDQYGIVYEMDWREGRLISAFALGEKTVQADFEGIAFADEYFFLITSDGRLYRAKPGRNGERVSFSVVNTKLGKRCEIEGLAYAESDNHLLIACKQPRSKKLNKRIAIFYWSLTTNRLLENETIIIKESVLRKKLDIKAFNPSGIEIDRHTGHIILVAARQRAIAEIDPNGEVISARRFPLASRHRQAEGIALTSENQLIVADEGGKKKARLAVYQPDLSQ
ncbi:MAG: SdiA-regulated domain-containing protein [Gammaproteobacteria bacterium]|nr:SdiA-regulated domain-containing protein [Gammaproteobacteria bacterium]